MTKEKMNKQGVRDLNTAKNGRTISQAAGCFHEWKHDRECVACSVYYGYKGGSCIESCRKCGKVR